MSKGDVWERKTLDGILGGAALALSATVYVALFTVAPTEAAGTGTEVSGGAYARASVTNNATNWPAATTDGAGVSSKANGTTITFPTATAAWGTIVAFAIMDAASGGNKLYYGNLSTSKAIASGDTATFAAGAIVCTED